MASYTAKDERLPGRGKPVAVVGVGKRGAETLALMYSEIFLLTAPIVYK